MREVRVAADERRRENSQYFLGMRDISAAVADAFRYGKLVLATTTYNADIFHSLREEVKPYGIDVTAICPGDIRTEFTKNRVKNFTTNERYGDRIRKADDHISAREHKRMSVDYACGKIEKIIAKKRYKPFYIVGRKYKALYAAYRLFPLSVILNATGKIFAPKEKNASKNEK